jgi:hypothetical protein
MPTNSRNYSLQNEKRRRLRLIRVLSMYAGASCLGYPQSVLAFVNAGLVSVFGSLDALPQIVRIVWTVVQPVA